MRVYPVLESKDHPSFALQRKSDNPKRFHAFQENRWEVDTLDTTLSDLGSDKEYGETELKVGDYLVIRPYNEPKASTVMILDFRRNCIIGAVHPYQVNSRAALEEASYLAVFTTYYRNERRIENRKRIKVKRNPQLTEHLLAEVHSKLAAADHSLVAEEWDECAANEANVWNQGTKTFVGRRIVRL
jgi:hypothetical protein